MAKTATMLLNTRPTQARCEDIALELAAQCGFADQKISWFLSDELPPVGFPVHQVDQFLAHKRDEPESIFMTVLMENATEEEDVD